MAVTKAATYSIEAKFTSVKIIVQGLKTQSNKLFLYVTYVLMTYTRVHPSLIFVYKARAFEGGAYSGE